MPNDTWTIKRCLDWTRDYLRDKGDERPRLSAEWLLAGVCGLTRTDIYVGFDKPMSEEELAAMHAAVVRRAKGEPLQYIVGETGFRHCLLYTSGHGHCQELSRGVREDAARD